MRLFDEAGIETTGQRGYHILVRLARNALICLGPMQGKQQTIVLLDDWAPRGASRDLPREAALSELASRFATSRGPVTTQDFARWAGIPVTEAEQGLRAAAGLARRSLDGVDYWLAADQADGPPPSAGRRRTYLRPGSTSTSSASKDRGAVVDPSMSARSPGANGVFRPLIVTGGQIVGTWDRAVRGQELTVGSTRSTRRLRTSSVRRSPRPLAIATSWASPPAQSPF